VTTFNVGDTVQLKSGGPPLTVTEVKTAVKVAWITPEGTAREAFFPAECLVACTPLREQHDLPRCETAYRYPPINFTVSMGDSDGYQAL
jgi:uncharacterized protein YodC (DUF2158 family)